MTGEDFARRVTELTPVLYRMCYMQLRTAADREDALQEAIFRAWEKRGTLRKEEFFKSWLIRILLNVCHDMQKRQKRVVPVEEIPERAAETDDRSAELRSALFELDEKLRVPVILHYIDGYSVRDIARILDISENAVKLRMLRGRKKLREILMEEVFEA